MTQTNQNKDYSWQWLDDLYQPSISNLELDERHGKDRPVIYLDQAKAAIQQHIDKHYTGKGEAEHSMLCNLLAIIHRDGGHYITKHGLDKAWKDAKRLSAERLDKKYTESELQQRCLEAQIDELEQWASFFEDSSMNGMTPSERLRKRIEQLSTNNNKEQS